MHLTTSIEVFKTNICSAKQARQLKAVLLLHFPHCRINFDLEDCDRILRTDGHIQNELVKQLGEELGIRVEELLD